MGKKISLLIFIILLISIFRSEHLLSQPPFLDEAIYSIYARDIAQNPNAANLLKPLNEGISPVSIYLHALMNIFFHNPILSGRLLSILLYTASIILFYKYLRQIKSPNAFLGITFFAFNPFIFLYSQMALLEMCMITFSILLILLTEIVLTRKGFLTTILIIPSFFLVVFSKFTGGFILIYFLIRALQSRQIKKLGFFLAMLLFSLFFLLPYIQKLFPVFTIHAQDTGTWQLTRIRNNMFLIANWLIDYFSIIPLFCVAGILLHKFIFKKINGYIFSGIVINLAIIIFFAIFSTNFFPRYLILITIFIAIFFAFVKSGSFASFLVTIIILVRYLPTDYQIIFNLNRAHIAKEDVYQYTTDWTSGKNIISNLKKLKTRDKICIMPDTFNYFSIVKESYFPEKQIELLKISSSNQCPRHTKILTPLSP